MRERFRMKNALRNNKGVAMISILIAVSFVSIIGAALLFITYTNFQMKVQNVQSKRNFYETDGQLVKLTTGLRNAADKPSSAEAYISGLTEIAPGSNVKMGTYDIDTLLPLIGVSSNPCMIDGDTYTFKTNGTAYAKYEGNKTTYTLKDISVTQKTTDGYLNKVQTDVELQVFKQVKGGGGNKGVGEFSMLMDSPLEISSGQFSFMTVYGDTFFSSYDYGPDEDHPQFDTFNGSGVYTMPGNFDKPAVKLMGDTKINIEGEYCVIFGDLVMTDNSCFMINDGNLTIYGDVYLLDRSTLICNGNLFMPEGTLPGRSDQCSIYSDTNPMHNFSGTDLSEHLWLPGGLSGIQRITNENYDNFATTLGLNDGDKDNDGVAAQIMPVLEDVEFTSGGSTHTTDYDLFEGFKDGSSIKYDTDFYGEPAQVVFENNTTPAYGDIKENSLVFMARTPGMSLQWDSTIPPWGANVMKKNGTDVTSSVIRSTLISKQPIRLNVQHGVYVSKMGSDVFNYLTVKSDDTDNAYYDSDIHSFSFNHAGTSGAPAAPGSGDVFGSSGANLSAGDFFAEDANTTVSNILSYGVNGGSGSVTYINSVKFNNYAKDKE